MPKTKKLEAAIDAAIDARIADGFRTHLGASIIGRECARDIWYSYRWAKRADHSARIQRIFDRGNEEEEVFEKLLNHAGLDVLMHDKKGNQFRIEDLNGHFGGSLDSVCRKIPDLAPEDVAVAEFKTHGEKSFKDLVKNGVEKSKFEHYVQGTIYAVKKKVKWVLYCAVNKNTDELYFELYKAKKSIAAKYIKRAKYIIFSEEPPPRIAKTKTFFKCKFCRHRSICWEKEIPAINCRTCGWSEPTKDGQWICNNPDSEPDETLDVKRGCTLHMFNCSMLQGFKAEFDESLCCVILDVDGKKIKHGTDEAYAHVTSEQLFKRFNK